MLSSYAIQALATLQQLHPDLAALAIEEDSDFNIDTVSPSGWPLWLWSEGEGLIVGFAEWHGHFDWPEGAPAQDATNAVALIKEFQSGQLELVSWYVGEQYAGSATHEAGAAIDTPDWLNPPQPELRYEIRQWQA